MSSLLIVALGAVLLAANQPANNTNAFSASASAGANTGLNLPSAKAESAPASANTTASNEAIEKEYEKILDEDDTAQADADKWIKDNQQFAAKGGGIPESELSRRIRARFELIAKSYEDFLKRNPKHTRARIAYGSFLNDTGDEEAARTQWETALTLDTNNPAIYNNLANVYGHTGPVKKAFEFYEKALQLEPRESTYYHNLGTVVYLFRNDAQEYYNLNTSQVFDKALALYSNAMRLDPDNFPLASDVAQTYYGIQPLRPDDALKAWTNTLKIAHDDIEREGVYIHFVRIKTLAGRYSDARDQLNTITNAMYADLKKRLVKNLDAREAASKTNSPPITTSQ